MRKFLFATLLVLGSLFYYSSAKEVGIKNPPAPTVEELFGPLTEASFFRSLKCNVYPIVSRNIHDADTFKKTDITIKEFNIVLVDQDIRISNFDACEVSRVRQTVEITDLELKVGKEALAYVIDLSKKYQLYITTDGKRDVYGRLLCEVYLSDKDHPNQFISLKDLIFWKKYDRSQLQSKIFPLDNLEATKK